MSWFADLAGKAESLLNNIDEQTGAVLRNHSTSKDKRHDIKNNSDLTRSPKSRSPIRTTKKNLSKPEIKINNGPVNSRSPKSHQSRYQSMETPVKTGYQRKISPNRKNTQYSATKAPMTYGLKSNNNVKGQFGLRKRRNSLPSDLEISINQDIVYNMKTLEMENTMLKNDFNVVNREVSELLERLRKTEDELSDTQTKLSNSERVNNLIKNAKETLDTQLAELKSQLNHKSNIEIVKHKEHNQELKSEVDLLNDKTKHLEERIKQLDEETSNKDAKISKTEKELRLAQTKVIELQGTLDKTTTESQHLEKDWEAYKLRVKNMLYGKDNEIKLLREGADPSEEVKMLMAQIESLKEEKEELSADLSRAREDCNAAHVHVKQMEERVSAAERLASAVRDALRDERDARNTAEKQGAALADELQSLKLQSGQTVATLRLALQKKEDEINQLRQSGSRMMAVDPSALNVADYDLAQHNDKIQCLTQTLIQKQGKIDSLLADNNILRIQLGKLESKYKAEVSARSKYSHSVVHVQDGESRVRSRNYSPSPLSSLSVKLGVVIKRFPIFRTLIIFYMIGLHLWVLTVLFTSTPEDYVPKPTKL